MNITSQYSGTTPNIAGTQSNGLATTAPQANTALNSTQQNEVNVVAQAYKNQQNGVGTTTPTASTTTISNGNKMSQVPGITAKTTQLAQTGVTTDPSTGVATTANGSAYTPPQQNPNPPSDNTGITAAGGYVGDIYYAPGATLPKDSNGNFATTSNTSPTDTQIMDNLNGILTQTDAQTASTIQGIQQQYQQLIQQQQTANKSQEAGVNNALLMGGATGQGSSAQYAPVSSSGIIGAQVSYGIQQINDLQNKENAAIAAAQAAGNAQKFQVQDRINQEISTIRDQKVAAATKLSDTIAAQNTKLADQAYQQKQATTTAINGILKDAADNGITDPKILSAIGNATTLEGAIAAAGGGLQKMTGDFADYPQYQKDAQANGLVPLPATDWLAKKQATEAKAKATASFNDAYNAKAGANAADNANSNGGGYNGTTQKQQQTLEQQYRQVLGKEFSARTGALGIENAKVNQANHLDSLLKQYYDPKTGNYNVPTSQYAELVMGLATLVSPTGSSEADRAALMSKTAAGDLKGALQYITGVPQTGNTQDIIKNLADSIDRQATTAVSNRQAALDNMKSQAPTDLDPKRVDALNKSTEMVPYSGADRVAKTTINDFLTKNGNTVVPLADGQHSLWYVVSTLANTPGATPQSVQNYLQANGWMQ